MMDFVFRTGSALLSSDTPMEILGDPSTIADANSFIRRTGITALGQVLNIAGILSAGIVILASLGMLLIVNYPKTVAQTKEKIANALMVVAFIAAFPLVADAIYSVITGVFY